MTQKKKSSSPWWWSAAISVVINNKVHKQELEELKTEIIEHQGNEKMQDFSVADTTGERAAKIMDNPRIKFLELAVEAVDHAMIVTRNYSSDIQQYYNRIKLIDECYWKLKPGQRLPSRYISRAAMQVHISDSLAHKWRKEFLVLVAKKMGWEE